MPKKKTELTEEQSANELLQEEVMDQAPEELAEAEEVESVSFEEVPPEELPTQTEDPSTPDGEPEKTNEVEENNLAVPDEYPEELAQAEAQTPELSERQKFLALKFNELDRGLSPEERQEWNSIYASYRGRSALHGRIIGVDPLRARVTNRDTGEMEWETMYCAIVIPYRVRIVIPESELWEDGKSKPDYVTRNMVGANIDFIITKVDRENNFALASRRLALRARRWYFAHRPQLNREGARIKCKVLVVGPRRCLVECYGHDINMTQREMDYAAIPDLREVYHAGQELDCIVKQYNPKSNELIISVKEVESNPYNGAEERHPVGSKRLAVVSGKYGGGVFCNLPDGTVVMCNYSYQYVDSQFVVGDEVIVVIGRYDDGKKQIWGKILSQL